MNVSNNSVNLHGKEAKERILFATCLQQNENGGKNVFTKNKSKVHKQGSDEAHL